VTLTDLRIPNKGGIDAAMAIRSKFPEAGSFVSRTDPARTDILALVLAEDRPYENLAPATMRRGSVGAIWVVERVT